MTVYHDEKFSIFVGLVASDISIMEIDFGAPKHRKNFTLCHVRILEISIREHFGNLIHVVCCCYIFSMMPRGQNYTIIVTYAHSRILLMIAYYTILEVGRNILFGLKMICGFFRGVMIIHFTVALAVLKFLLV